MRHVEPCVDVERSALCHGLVHELQRVRRNCFRRVRSPVRVVALRSGGRAWRPTPRKYWWPRLACIGGWTQIGVRIKRGRLIDSVCEWHWRCNLAFRCTEVPLAEVSCHPPIVMQDLRDSGELCGIQKLCASSTTVAQRTVDPCLRRKPPRHPACTDHTIRISLRPTGYCKLFSTRHYAVHAQNYANLMVGTSHPNVLRFMSDNTPWMYRPALLGEHTELTEYPFVNSTPSSAKPSIEGVFTRVVAPFPYALTSP